MIIQKRFFVAVQAIAILCALGTVIRADSALSKNEAQKKSVPQAFARAWTKTFGSPVRAVTKPLAIGVGSIGGIFSGTAIGFLLIGRDEKMFTDHVSRSEQVIAYCLMTFFASVGCIAGGMAGNKAEEFWYTFYCELSSDDADEKTVLGKSLPS